jgi:hypothetical protein
MELIISNFDDLRNILNDPRITLTQAIKISESFCRFIVLDNIINKTELSILLDQYIDEYENLPSNFERPIFFNLVIDVES